VMGILYRITIILHNRYFRHDDYQNASCVTIQVGNVTADTELTYEYGIRTKSKYNLGVCSIGEFCRLGI